MIRGCFFRGAALTLLSLAIGDGARADPPVAAIDQKLPSFTQLESDGATIGKVRIDVQNIFDLSDPAENRWLFRLANRLHVGTRPAVVEQALLFKTGERLLRSKIEESERLLRSNRYLYDVVIRPVSVKDGVVDIDVVTRDTWTFDPTLSYSRTGGNNKTSFGFNEYNLFGTGLRVGFARSSDADRKGTEVEADYAQAFDGWTRLRAAYGKFDDGARSSASILRPFYALDTRWAAGISALRDNRIDSIVNAGNAVAQYRHRQQAGEVSAGWSTGLVDGWVWRLSGGVLKLDDAYALEQGRTPPASLPVNQESLAPFLHLQWLEDRFVRLKNRDQINRPEFFALGWSGSLQLAQSLTQWGSTQSAVLGVLAINNGVEFAAAENLLTQVRLERRIAGTGDPLTQVGAGVRWFAPQRGRGLFYAAVFADAVHGGGVIDQLTLGGNNGLRGYPSRFQAGERRLLATVEQRAYTDWYPFRLVRVGGAVFFDAGRAWNGPNRNVTTPGWLADAGAGLRFALDRAAFANVLHVDIAVPLKRPEGVKPVQFVVKTELTF